MYLGLCERVASYCDIWSKRTLVSEVGPFSDSSKISSISQLGVSDLSSKRRNHSCLIISRKEGVCFCHRAVTPVGDEIPASPDAVEEGVKVSLATRYHQDLSSLPKPLSSAKLFYSFSDGAKVRVAYQGIPGAYSEDAAVKAYPNCEPVPCGDYEDVFKAVELWLVDKAVLPIEDSVGGSIHRNYDLLLRHRLHIVGEVQMIVNHCLLGLPGVKKNELKLVASHPLALNHCDITLNKLGVKRISAIDSASAAQMVASKGVREMGAIASARAGKIYGLGVLEEGLQDDSNNVTRCLILAREPIIPGTERSHKIESRPLIKRPLRIVDDCNSGSAIYFDYLFYIDFEASMAEPRAQYALGNLQEFSRFIRVLGCYPIDLIP
ncbi:hypothetical protein ACS0TY_031987 [Phlomoides rotata]